ncbi:MAG: histidine kinase dimerization/phospho-acceptor domain-containing protein, partial [Calditrichia bacterium]
MNLFNKDPFSKIAIRYKLPLSFIILYLVVFGIGGYLIVNSVYDSLDREIMTRLKNESLAQATLFDKRLEMLLRRAEDFSSDGFIRARTDEIVQSNAGTGSYKNKQTNRQVLQTHLRVNKLPLIDEFFDLQIFDIEYNKITGVSEKDFDLSAFLETLSQPDEQKFSSIIPPDTNYSFPAAAILTPLWNIERSNKIGYLICFVNLEILIENISFEYEAAFTESSTDKHLILIDQAGMMLDVPWNYLKRNLRIEFQNDDKTGIRVIPSTKTEAATRHIGRHACKAGDVMFGQSMQLHSNGWNILIELNMQDAMKPIKTLEKTLIGIAIVIALSTLIMLFFPVQFVIRPLGEMQRMAFKIKEGDFSVRVKINSQDEIGNLANMFNLMAAAIEERTRSLQKRENELRVQHKRLQTVVNSMSDGLILLNNSNKIILSNAAAEPFRNFLKNKNNDFSVRKCIKPSSSLDDCLVCLLDTGRLNNCVLQIGQTLYEVVSSQLLTGKILVVRDITEREKIAEQQTHQERLAVLGRTAAVVAHEMNSPLAAISMYNQMMETELKKDSPFHEHVDVIKRNTLTCQRIIRELLDYAKLPDPKIEEINLQQIILNV